jgi:hypothetical protein
VQPATAVVRLPGVQRWVDQHGLISLAGFRYRVPIVLAGEPVEAVAAEHLVRIFTVRCWSLSTCNAANPTPVVTDPNRCGRAAAVPGDPPTG